MWGSLRLTPIILTESGDRAVGTVYHLEGGVNCRGEGVHCANVPGLEAAGGGVRVHGSLSTRED